MPPGKRTEKLNGVGQYNGILDGKVNRLYLHASTCIISKIKVEPQRLLKIQNEPMYVNYDHTQMKGDLKWS